MNSETSAVANSTLMLLLCGTVIVIVAVQAVIFLVRANKEAGNLGISKEIRKKVIVNAGLFSILPSLPIVIILAVLLPVLGQYLPWLRLSVIGSAMYENMAADITVKTFGLSGVADSGMTPSIFLSVAWVMTLGVILYPVANIVFLKSYTGGIRKAQSKGGFLHVGVPSMFVGLMGVYAGPYVVNFKNPTGITTVVVAGVLVFAFDAIAKKSGVGWLKDFSFPLAMVAGMASAILFNWVFFA